MKKIIAIITIIAICAFFLTDCNMGMGLGTFDFTKIHFQCFDQCADATIIKWYESGTGIEVNTKEYGSLFASEGTYILYNGVCPLCGEGDSK